MTDHEQPQHGGSYVRGEDGKLTRAADAAAAEAPAKTDDTRPAGRSAAPAKSKAEK